MVQETDNLADKFTYDLTELNDSLSFIVSLSKVTGRHIKFKQNGALAVFRNMRSFRTYALMSQVAKDSNPYEVSLEQMKEIANKESEGFYEIL